MIVYGVQFRKGVERLKDCRTGKFTTPKLRHIFLNDPNSSDSLVVFRSLNNKRGYLNINTGKIIIPVQYDRAWNFSEGIAAVYKNGKLSFITETGEAAFPKEFAIFNNDDFRETAFLYHHGLCVMQDNNCKWGLINQQGEWVVTPQYTASRMNTMTHSPSCSTTRKVKNGILIRIACYDMTPEGTGTCQNTAVQNQHDREISIPKARRRASVWRMSEGVARRTPSFLGNMSSTRSAVRRARSSSWVEIRMVLPCSWAMSRNRFKVLIRESRSRCAVGSSRRMTGVCWARALAIRIRCFSPSEWSL
ncbi:MAG: WG repeat-containing protein [Paludibacteraceae bacterium]|nr:WG repeat-containing protein [Paludibacteraceae bacterium]